LHGLAGTQRPVHGHFRLGVGALIFKDFVGNGRLSPSLRQNMAENPVKSMIYGVFVFRLALFDDSHQLSRLIGRPTTSLKNTIAMALKA
jgi:hypothetical protein